VFHKFFEWIKAHPVTVAPILGALVIVWLVSGSGSSNNSGTAVASGPSDAAVQAGTALSIAQIGAGVQGQQISAQLSAVNTNAAAGVTIAGLNADVAKYQTEQQANVAGAGIQAQQNVQIAGFQTQQVIAIANNATQVSLAQTAADVEQARISSVASIYNAPYIAQSNLYDNLAKGGTDNQGRNGLVQLLYGAEGTKGSELILPGGVAAGRVGSGGGSLFGSTYGGSSSPLGGVANFAAALVSLI